MRHIFNIIIVVLVLGVWPTLATSSPAEKIAEEIAEKTIKNRLVKGMPYVGAIIEAAELRRLISKNLSLDARDPLAQQVISDLKLDPDKIIFYKSNHFTHIDLIRIFDKLAQDGGVAYMLSRKVGGSIWLWHPNPRYNPSSDNWDILVSRIYNKKIKETETMLYPAFWTRLQEFQAFKAYMKLHAVP